MKNTADYKEQSLIENLFVNIPDFPVPGFNFPDITPILERNPGLFRSIIDRMCYNYILHPPDYILCIESFGYVFGVPMALELRSRILLARRTGKLPRETLRQDYSMCYHPNKRLEIHSDVIRSGENVIIVDDFLASGGTAEAALDLIKKAGGNATGASFVVELVDMGGRKLIQKKNLHVSALFKMRFDKIEKKWRMV